MSGPRWHVDEVEPAGLGAVIQDFGGALWVRNGRGALNLPWYRQGDMCQRRWDQLGDVQILSHGLTKATQLLAHLDGEPTHDRERQGTR